MPSYVVVVSCTLNLQARSVLAFKMYPSNLTPSTAFSPQLSHTKTLLSVIFPPRNPRSPHLLYRTDSVEQTVCRLAEQVCPTCYASAARRGVRPQLSLLLKRRVCDALVGRRSGRRNCRHVSEGGEASHTRVHPSQCEPTLPIVSIRLRVAVEHSTQNPRSPYLARLNLVELPMPTVPVRRP